MVGVNKLDRENTNQWSVKKWHTSKKSIEELLIKNIVHLVCFSITHSLQTMTECPLVDNQITRQKFTSNNNILVLDVFPEMKKHISIQYYNDTAFLIKTSSFGNKIYLLYYLENIYSD